MVLYSKEKLLEACEANKLPLGKISMGKTGLNDKSINSEIKDNLCEPIYRYGTRTGIPRGKSSSALKRVLLPLENPAGKPFILHRNP